jgi:hypothetical protein
MDLKNVLSVSEEPRCKQAHDKVVEVQLQAAEIERKIAEHLSQRQRAGATLDDQARDYLRNNGNVATVPGLCPEDKTIEELYRVRRINARALKIAKGDYQSAVDNYSREIAPQIQRPYQARAQAIADALVIVMQAVRSEREFRGVLEDKGISITLPSAAFSYLGLDLDNPNAGFAARWISDSRAAGLIR